MKNKYYTPEIEEFHVGFEYKRVLADGHEDYLVYEADDYISIHDQLDDPGLLILVKYLDREDIESFGFEYSFDSSEPCRHRTYYFLNKERGKNRVERIALSTLKYPNGNIHVCIGTNRYGQDVDDILFFGYIKNKSELRRVLKQVGVL